MKECERCPATISGDNYQLFDYCVECSKNLCNDCMGNGCCGNVPALSGMEADNDVFCEYCNSVSHISEHCRKKQLTEGTS